MSLRLLRCEFCKHFHRDINDAMCCDAFPDEIPDDKKSFDFEDDSECANGVKYEDENNGLMKFILEPESLLERMHRI